MLVASPQGEDSPVHTSVPAPYALKLHLQRAILCCCVWLPEWTRDFFSLLSHKLLPKRREANSWNSYLVVGICFLGYKLRGTFRSQGCILLCVVQTWKKKTVLTSDLMQLSHRIKVSNREGCKETRDNTDKRWFWHCFAPRVCFPIGG